MLQAVCEWGRESVESWGKRRRRNVVNATEEKSEDMTLSQEILVLDFGDEKQTDFLKNDASIDFNELGKFLFTYSFYIHLEAFQNLKSHFIIISSLTVLAYCLMNVNPYVYLIFYDLKKFCSSTLYLSTLCLA